MAGRMYAAPFSGISLTNDSDQDIWELVNGSASAVVLHGFTLTSATTSDERLVLRLLRRTTTGSGGSAATEVALDGGNTVAAGAAIATLVTTPGTGGAVIDAFIWSQLSPWIYLPTPETRVIVPPSGRIACHVGTAVGSTRTISGSVVWEEIG